MSREIDFSHSVKAALKSDVEELFKHFIRGPLTYQSFWKCFKDMEFWSIFVGRISVSDSYELDEEFFQYVASLIFPTSMRTKNFHMPKVMGFLDNEKDFEQAEQFFGIFLSYTAYFLQPQQEVKFIRLPLNFVEYLPTILDNLVTERQLHALFCLQRLITSKAFIIVPFGEEFNPLFIRQKQQNVRDDLEDFGKDFHRLKSVIESKDVQYVSELHQKYADLKRRLEVTGNLNRIKDDVKKSLTDIVKDAEQQLKKDQEKVEDKQETLLEKMAALRHRAFTSEIRLPSHRIAHDRSGKDRRESLAEEDEPGPSVSPRKRKEKRKVDVIQQRARVQLTIAKHKKERIRQETVGDGDISDSELLRREVETDVANAIAKTNKRRSPRKNTKSITIEPDANDDAPSTISSRRRSQRLKSKDPVVVKGVLLPTPEEASGVTKEALKILDKQRDTDQALEKLRSLKK